MKGDAFGRLVRAVTRRPLLVLAVTAVLAVGGAGLALRLEPSTATETLVDRGSDTFEATERFKRDFGDEAVLVLVRGDLTRTVLTPDLARVLALEGCLSGNVPDKRQGLGRLPRVCRELAELRPAKVVYGPGTFINTAATRCGEEFLNRQRASEQDARRAAAAARSLSRRRGDAPAEQDRLARAAAQATRARFQSDVLRLALRYGLTDIPRIDSPNFVSTLVFDSSAGEPGVPKSRFAYLFPSKNAALIQIRLRPDLTDEERRQAIGLIQEATQQRAFQPREGARYIVTGVPVVAERLADAIERSIFVLLGAALLVMAATLALVFRTRLRLLPLALAVAAVGAAAAGGPTILTAGIATAVGFLVLLLSPVPMVRSFGLLLVLGIALALACALGAGFAALVRLGALPPPSRPRSGFVPTVGINRGGVVARAGYGAREWVADRSWRALGFSLQRPRRVLAIGLALAVAGLALDTRSEVVSDVRELVPQDLQALRDVDALQEETGVSGEIDVTVRADDITRPAVVRWMTRFQDGVLSAHGYRSGKRCTQERNAPELCPALSLPDLFSTAGGQQGQVRALLDAVPPYFSQGVVTPDRRTANLAFGIRLMPLDRQKEVVDDIKSRLDPPAGVQASVVGLPVLAAEANGALSSTWRRGLTLVAALVGVFLVLLAARRSVRGAAVPLIPIALATGWSGGLLFLLGLLPGPLAVDLNPMSVTLAALVIAISTEFSVLLSARYQRERDGGAGPARAIDLAYASTGAAVLASGVTAIAGFAVLIASDIRMLRDFGIVTVLDLTVSLLGVMLVLPAALMWAEQHGPFRVRDLDLRARSRGLRMPRPRRAHAE